MYELIPLLVFAITMLILGAGMMIFSKLISPRRPSLTKSSTYECGEVPVGEGRTRFVMQYWAYAIFFTIFDVLVAFMIVFSTALARLGTDLLVYILVFIGVMALALMYSWKSIGKEAGL